MKKLINIVLLGVAALSLNAQQLTNAGFEENWGDCVPWTSNNNTQTMGQTPSPWTISHVIGINGTGKTQVGSEVDGYESVSAVNVVNSPNSTLATQTVPGYFTLGTTWSTSVMGKNNDGGTWGGIEFAYRPDALSFMYKRECTAAGAEEQPATVVAYLWKGSTSQASVPANIVILGSPKTCTMINRERNILDMSTIKGGAVTKSEDFARIATLNQHITNVTSDWMPYVMEFAYENDEIPTMFNLIFAANDYFSSTNIKQGNSLTIDDVKLIYYSRLSSLSVGGEEVTLLPEVYEYTMASLPEDLSEITTVANGKNATVTVSKEDDKVIIKVSNVDADIDGLTEHTYTLVEEEQGDTPEYDSRGMTGTLDIDCETLGGRIAEGQAAEIQIVFTSETTCSFTLPNFALGEGEEAMVIGDINVPELNLVRDDAGVETYSGSIVGLLLMDDMIDSDVTVDGTIDAENNASFVINVDWVMNRGETEVAPMNRPMREPESRIPITVTFNGVATPHTSGVITIAVDNSNAPVEYYNLQGVRVSNPGSGIYIRVQGTSISKVVLR